MLLCWFLILLAYFIFTGLCKGAASGFIAATDKDNSTGDKVAGAVVAIICVIILIAWLV